MYWRATDNLHLALYISTRDRRGKNAAGVAVKIRRPAHHGVPVWRHAQVGVYGAGKKRGRGCYTWEATTWITSPDQRTRTSVKAFLRVKLGLGGRERVVSSSSSSGRSDRSSTPSPSTARVA
jgi:hypothetical protein